MPLEAPTLDTRKFDDLLRETQLRIPRYTPDWTDFNDSDPGMTLVQLFAWLSEMLLYQMNQIPERNYIKFLQLLNLELRAAQSATAHLTFTPKPGAATKPILQRSQIGAQSPGGDLVIFETGAGLDLIRVPLADVQVSDGTSFTVVSDANAHPGQTFPPLGWVPQIGSALYLGFKQTDPPAPAPIFPQELRFRVFLPQTTKAAAAEQVTDTQQPAPTPPVTLVWEYKPNANPTRWRRLSLYSDESVAFTREGYILLQGPSDIAATAEGKVDEPRFWLRGRLTAGSYPAGREPEIDFIRPNTVPAINLSTSRGEIIGTSEGVPDQAFTLRYKPVQAASLTLQTLQVQLPDAKPETWTQQPDFFASNPDDPHYLLNPTTGGIRFGDGKHGRIPPATAQIIAVEYRYGGGTAGNVGAGVINAPLTSLEGVDTVSNERAAVGGADEQDVEDLKTRAPSILRSRGRAVTADDFAAFARQAGGVAKATAIALAHPDHPGVEVPGALTVVIVPDSEAVPPQPSSDLISSVCRYLNQFRLLTTEVYVKGPQYQAITVEAQVAAKAYAAFDQVADKITKALNAYLDPLGRGTAPKTSGWAFGQELHPTSLFAVILQASADIDSVSSLNVFVNGVPWDNMKAPVVVPSDGLLYGDAHRITVVPAEDL